MHTPAADQDLRRLSYQQGLLAVLPVPPAPRGQLARRVVRVLPGLPQGLREQLVVRGLPVPPDQLVVLPARRAARDLPVLPPDPRGRVSTCSSRIGVLKMCGSSRLTVPQMMTTHRAGRTGSRLLPILRVPLGMSSRIPRLSLPRELLRGRLRR